MSKKNMLRLAALTAAAALVLTACGDDAADPGTGDGGEGTLRIGTKYDQPGLGLDEVSRARSFRSGDEKEAVLLAFLEAVLATDGRPSAHLGEEAREAGWSDEQLKWKEERQREEQIRKQPSNPGQLEGTPEWYIKKFLDKTITPKQATGLSVSLRSNDIE